MTTRPRLDIGVVTWNTAGVTVDALRRTLDAIPPGVDVRLLVRDNGSTDRTADQIRAQVPEADLDAGSENLGFAAGMNTLIARSDAPWFLALNSDAWPTPGAIEALLATAEADPRAAAVAPLLRRPDGSVEHSTHRFPTLRQMLVIATAAYRARSVGDRFLLEGYWAQDRLRPVDWAVGAALLMRRSTLDQIGGFDESTFMYVEDLDWCHRAVDAGWRIVFDPAAQFVHVGNVSGGQRYGEQRTEAWLHRTLDWDRRRHGTLHAQALRVLNLVAAARLWVASRRRPDQAERWAQHVRAARSWPAHGSGPDVS